MINGINVLFICSDAEGNWRNKPAKLTPLTAYEAGIDNKKVLPLDNYARKLQKLRAESDRRQKELDAQAEKDRINEEYLKQRELEREVKLKEYEAKLRAELLNDAPPGGVGTVGVDSSVAAPVTAASAKNIAVLDSMRDKRKSKAFKKVDGAGDVEVEDDDEDAPPKSKTCIVS